MAVKMIVWVIFAPAWMAESSGGICVCARVCVSVTEKHIELILLPSSCKSGLDIEYFHPSVQYLKRI